MEAKDTVINLDAYLDDMGWIISKDGMQYAWLKQALKRQAEISFKAGRQEQLKECLSDLTSADGAGDLKTLEKNITNLIYSWQAKLKEGGL